MEKREKEGVEVERGQGRKEKEGGREGGREKEEGKRCTIREGEKDSEDEEVSEGER